MTRLRERTENCDVPDGVRRALAEGRRWLSSADADGLAASEGEPVLGHGDGNLANVLWDGRRCRLVDFEDAGSSDRAFEYADLVEHVSSWSTDAETLPGHLPLGPGEVGRTRAARRLMALHWLVMLLPGNPAAARNPPGSADRQAARLLGLLG